MVKTTNEQYYESLTESASCAARVMRMQLQPSVRDHMAYEGIAYDRMRSHRLRSLEAPVVELDNGQ